MKAGSVSRLLLGLLSLSCRGPGDQDPLVERAAFGVFFGGQIQDRQELPFELDPTKQRSGIRIEFRAPLTRPVNVGWEIARPARAHADKSSAATDAIVEVGDARARPGESRLDVPLLLRPGQVLGTWHVRVKVDGRVAIDRDVLVFDPRERRERDADAGR